MTTFTAETLEQHASRYETVQPLATVEAEHLEILPATFADGEYGWRDLEWVVQWYFRRFLGAYPNADRRAAESAFGENAYDAVHESITGAVEADSTAAKLECLVDLTGVDYPIASAFLSYLDPARYVVMGPAEWTVLADAGELEEAYPETPSLEDYRRYLEACIDIRERCNTDLWTVYRGLWMEWYESLEGVDPSSL